ncbi:hypothetical protein [Sphingomonas elodea]|uniref:hypothetical protein n=1 Tax=Sphingomonas elodea TaxID=179878 RepID=UPI0002631E21|nr:hypothetical protein [Sphingomonas elodea]
MGPSPDVIRQRVAEQCAKSGISLAQLSRILGKQDGYIARFVRDQVPYELASADRDKVARYFGLPGPHFGAPARMDDRRAHAIRMRQPRGFRTVLRRAT